MSRKLYVGNLPYDTGEADLQQLFARAGTVDHTYARLREQQDAMGEMPDDVRAAAAAGDAASPYRWMAVRRDGEVIGHT